MPLRGELPPEPTSRELEVLALVCDGWSMDEVAGLLGVSRPTVQVHLKHLYRRLGVVRSKRVSRSSALAAAVKLGWLHVPDEVRRAA
jgi:ATP/maltotriose-dependent transcriptional regulator MalT